MAATQWEQYYNHSVHVSFSVEMSRLIYSSIQCRAKFLSTTNKIYVGNRIPIEVLKKKILFFIFQVQFKNSSNFKFKFNKCLLALDEISATRNTTTTIILENSLTNIVLDGNSEKILTLYFFITPTLDGSTQLEKQILVKN